MRQKRPDKPLAELCVLIKHMMLSAPEQLWVSDITYIRTQLSFSYLSLITDAYSRKIVGFALHPNLEATGCVIALEMAINGREKDSSFILVHHSDRGVHNIVPKTILSF